MFYYPTFHISASDSRSRSRSTSPRSRKSSPGALKDSSQPNEIKDVEPSPSSTSVVSKDSVPTEFAGNNSPNYDPSSRFSDALVDASKLPNISIQEAADA